MISFELIWDVFFTDFEVLFFPVIVFLLGFWLELDCVFMSASWTIDSLFLRVRIFFFFIVAYFLSGGLSSNF